MMNKTIKFNGIEIEINWQASGTRRKIVNLFDRAAKDCQAVNTGDSIKDAAEIETIYRDAFSGLFGEEKVANMFPDDAGINDFFELIDLMIQLKEEQDAYIKEKTETFAALANLS